ncbi:MAG: bifunctional folylpolyglutamate synthase/dihydrofolate synthase [Bacteroidales bacterium]|nr:bifunctional folylpolyglutamate synthase/dihydrofolate synthase [Bacteroidales bacterium]
MSYEETLDYLFSALPAYHRIGAAAYKADLANTEAMMNHLGHPERGFRSIHVAGTNGKGSVSHFLASILQEAGYKVGLYTSPHLVDFRERIRINGQMIPQQEVVTFVQKHKSFFEPQGLSFFEMTVGLAFDYFRNRHVDIAVIEVGMGGRLDSTNVITPLLSVITNIGLDHTQFLGDTLEKIAAEKAGIIKTGIPVVVGQTQPETQPVFQRIAAERCSPITFADKHWHVDPNWRFDGERMVFQLQHNGQPIVDPTSGLVLDFTSGLIGPYQMWNIATVCQAVQQLRQTTTLQIDSTAFRRGLDRVVDNTHLMGRWQIVGRQPLTICETAHNFDGINAMMLGLAGLHFKRLHIIYGCVADKDYNKILAYLHSQLNAEHIGQSPIWRFSQPSVQRRLPVGELQTAAHQLGIDGQAFTNVNDAIDDARRNADPDDLVLVTGSIFLIADVLTPNA